MSSAFDLLLSQLLAEAPASDNREARGIQTPRVLVALASERQSPPTPEERQSLDALCRKIHVAGKVKASYGRSWRSRRGTPPLPRAFWPLLIAVLLAAGRLPEHAKAQVELGLALKCLNAALAALDLAAQIGEIPHLEELETEAARLLLQSEGMG